MEKREKHFVLVHGACHGAWCWYKVVTLLKSWGHKVTALDMAASGIHPKRCDELRSMSDYFEPLMEFMASVPPEERVILVAHSMGGVCISVAMEKFPQKIAVAVFATALMPGPDLTLPTVNQELYRGLGSTRTLGSTMDIHYTFDKGTQNSPTSFLFDPNSISSKLYHSSPSEDMTLASMLLRPIRVWSDREKLKETRVTKERYGSVRRVYIVCNRDRTIKEEMQRWMIENNPTDEVMVISASDHMVMFSNPLELCSCLQGIAHNYS